MRKPKRCDLFFSLSVVFIFGYLSNTKPSLRSLVSEHILKQGMRFVFSYKRFICSRKYKDSLCLIKKKTCRHEDFFVCSYLMGGKYINNIGIAFTKSNPNHAAEMITFIGR